MIHVEVVDDKECITVAEYAAMAGISLSTAYRRLRDSQMTKYIVTRENGDNRKFVDISVLSGIQPLSRENHILTNENHIVTDDNVNNVAKNALVDTLREEITLLRGQIEIKDAEVDRLHVEIDKLHALLDQAHQLAAMSQTKELEAPQRRWWRRKR